MGEIADMILDGTLDAETGEYLGDENIELFGTESPGFPRKRGDAPSINTSCAFEEVRLPVGVKVICPICKKRVKAVGLAQHMSAAHQTKESP